MPIGPRPGFACIAAGDTPRSRGFEHAAARAARAPIAQRRTPAGAVQPHSDQRDRAHDHGTEHGTDAKLKPCAERGVEAVMVVVAFGPIVAVVMAEAVEVVVAVP